MLTAKIPCQHLKKELIKELALQLYREGIVAFANARRLADLSKIEFHYMVYMTIA
jgi:predicted HTH domain antitoxin